MPNITLDDNVATMSYGLDKSNCTTNQKSWTTKKLNSLLVKEWINLSLIYLYNKKK